MNAIKDRPKERLQELSTINLNVSEIYADPNFNCRGFIAPIDVIELRKSIDINGLHQPIVVRAYNVPPYKWRVIMGHRRHRAFQMPPAYETIPSIIRNDVTETEAQIMNLIENIERKDLTFMQGARALERFEKSQATPKEIAKMINKSLPWVNTRLNALRLPSEIQMEIDAGFINQEQVNDLCKLPNNEIRMAVVKEIKEATFRGEKKKIKIFDDKPIKYARQLEKKLRTVTEIYKLQDTIRDTIGNNLSTRVLGWVAGLVNTKDVLEDLRDEANKLGKIYVPPKEEVA